MSENIIISDGIEKPWELPGTDYEKPDNIILANLAMGQLAFLGSKFGKYLNTQAMVTAELAEAVEKVKARSIEASTLLKNWNTEPPKLDPSLPATGWPPYNVPELAVPGMLVDLTRSPPENADKLIVANNLISENDIANRWVRPLNSSIVADGILPCTYKFGPTSDGKTLQGISFNARTVTEYEALTVYELQIYYKKIDSSGKVDYAAPFVRYQGVEYPVTDLKTIWVPGSQEEINYFNNQLACVNKTQGLEIFSDTTQLVPTPTEANTVPASDPGSIAQPAVTMEIPLTQFEYFLEFKLENGDYYYYQKSASNIPSFTADTALQNVGSVVQMSDKSYRYVVEVTNASGVKTFDLVRTELPKIGIKTFTKLQQSDIISKYADKNVRITQRSSEQATYVTALVQRYNYFFEAATNILKAFTNLWSSLSSNI